MERPPSSRPSTDRGAIDEIQLDGAARPRLLTSAGDRLLVALFAVALGAGVVLGLDSLFGTTEGPPVAPVAASTTAPASPTLLAEPSSSPTARPQPSPSPTATPDAVQLAWQAAALPHRGENGEEFSYRCPPRGATYPIWGTRIYTDDSSVCTAAVHMGLITIESGGEVRIVIRPGRGGYGDSRRNDITSLNYGPWDGSFAFVR